MKEKCDCKQKKDCNEKNPTKNPTKSLPAGITCPEILGC